MIRKAIDQLSLEKEDEDEDMGDAKPLPLIEAEPPRKKDKKEVEDGRDERWRRGWRAGEEGQAIKGREEGVEENEKARADKGGGCRCGEPYCHPFILPVA